MAGFLLEILFTIVFVVGAVIGLSFFWKWLYSSDTSQDETHYFPAKDGWRLAAHRYAPAAPTGKYPVILCHGMCSNRYTFDIPRGPSLAKYLSRKGMDVWVVELRGSGESAKPRLFWSDVPYSWGFNDILEKDVPAIIEYVLSRTGADKAHWVGHSMGGMLIQARLAYGENDFIASAVTLGSLSDPAYANWTRYKGLLKLNWLVRWSKISFIPFFARSVAPLGYQVSQLTGWLFHADNVSPLVARRTVALASELVTPSRLWLELGRFGIYGKDNSAEIRNYAPGLRACPAPVMFIGGSRDSLAPPKAVCAASQHPDNIAKRECKIMGKESGCKEDYGHVDLLVGENVEEEVFPILLEWIDDSEKTSDEEADQPVRESFPAPPSIDRA